MADERQCSLLDVGCGYGALLEIDKKLTLDYTGIDMVEDMIRHGKTHHPDATFICGNFLDHTFTEGSFDYVICNGVMTQKLTASIFEMEDYARKIIRKMFSLSRKGIAFNMMTSYVNFMAPNLFYKNPSELLAWVMCELSPHVKLDHSYPLYEFMTYVYKVRNGNDSQTHTGVR
jgi:SAM-dependent methyltransferase